MQTSRLDGQPVAVTNLTEAFKRAKTSAERTMQAVASLEDMIDEIRPGLLRTRTERAPIAELINTTVIETSVAAERAVLDAEHAAAVSEACERAGSDAGFSNGSFLDMYRETSSNGVEQQGSPTTAQSAPQAVSYTHLTLPTKA